MTEMTTTWCALEKISLKCKCKPSDVHDPTVGTRENQTGERSGGKCRCSSGCSRSLSNLKDVIHGGRRHVMDKQKPAADSAGTPRSLVSSLGDIFDHITGEGVGISGSKCELEMTAEPIQEETCSEVRNSVEAKSCGFMCHKCDEKFTSFGAIEVHYLSHHAGNVEKFTTSLFIFVLNSDFSNCTWIEYYGPSLSDTSLKQCFLLRKDEPLNTQDQQQLVFTTLFEVLNLHLLNVQITRIISSQLLNWLKETPPGTSWN